MNLHTPKTVSEVVSTLTGQYYGINFFADADTANTFLFTENGLTIASTPTSIASNGFPSATNSSLFTNYTGFFVATSATTTLTLDGHRESGAQLTERVSHDRQRQRADGRDSGT